MRRHLVALVAVTSLVTSLTTFGQSVYTWEDADGLHFTDDPAQVPPKAKVKVLAPSAPTGVPEPAPLEVAPTGAQVPSSSSPEPRPTPAPVSDSGPATAAEPSASVPTVEGPPPSSPEPATDRDAPLDERAWRARFVTATRRVATLRDRVTTLERGRASRADCVPEPLSAAEVSALGGAPRCRSSASQERLQARLGEVRGELREAELELEALDREASSLSVPREWRRGW